MNTQRALLAVLCGIILGAFASYGYAEDITVTTYYPSPRGIYEQLQTTDNTSLATDGGNVGIGTTSPSAKLDIVGNSKLNGQVDIVGSHLLVLGKMAGDPAGGPEGAIYYNTTTDQFRGYHNGSWDILENHWTLSGGDLFTAPNVTGNVGIGDASPLALLTVGDGDLFRVNSTGRVNTIAGTAALPAFSFTADPNTGIYNVGPDQLRFVTAGTDRMFIDSTGLVGIRNAPVAAATSDVLQIGNFWSFHNGGDKAFAFNAYWTPGGGWTYRQTNAAGAAVWYYGTAGWPLRLRVAAGGVAGAPITWTPALAADSSGNVGFGTDFWGMGDGKVTIKADYNAVFPAADNGGQLVIEGETNGDRRIQMGMDTTDNYGWIRAGGFFGPFPLVLAPDGGDVGIGTTTPGYTLHVVGDAAKTVGGTLWTVPSDARLKKNVRPLEGALDQVSQLRGVAFEWIEPERHGGQAGIQRGLIAQEVETVFPEWVGTNAEGYKDLTMTGFEALAIEAIKALKAENDQLKTRLEAMERRLANPEAAK